MKKNLILGAVALSAMTLATGCTMEGEKRREERRENREEKMEERKEKRDEQKEMKNENNPTEMKNK
jgi:hypothetical protein